MSGQGAGHRDEGGDVTRHEEARRVNSHGQDDDQADVEEVPFPGLQAVQSWGDEVRGANQMELLWL